MKKSTVGETVLSFIFIFKGRSVDFHRHMKKKSYKIISINYFMVIVYPGIVRKSC